MLFLFLLTFDGADTRVNFFSLVAPPFLEDFLLRLRLGAAKEVDFLLLRLGAVEEAFLLLFVVDEVFLFLLLEDAGFLLLLAAPPLLAGLLLRRFGEAKDDFLRLLLLGAAAKEEDFLRLLLLGAAAKEEDFLLRLLLGVAAREEDFLLLLLGAARRCTLFNFFRPVDFLLLLVVDFFLPVDDLRLAPPWAAQLVGINLNKF